MNSKRKADLQRKLSLAPVPRPPAGLAERIKNDIPEYLRPDADRRRMSRSLSINLRVAASLLLLISAVVATMYLLEPEDQMKQITAVNRQGPTQVFAEREAAAATDEVQVEITQTAAAAAAPAEPVQLAYSSAGTATAAPARVAAFSREESGSAADAAGGSAPPAETTAAAALEPAPVPPPAAAASPMPQSIPAPEPVRATADASVAEQRAAPADRARTNSLIAEAHAADLDLGPRASVFGISVDPEVFHDLKATLESNQRPSAAAVNLEAIVNYFAGATSDPPRRGVKLEVEGSPSPVGGSGHRGFLRFTIDTAATATNTPVAADAKLEIEFNGRVVEHAAPVGDSAVAGPESALLQNLSVTGLYELTLKRNVRPTDRIATVKLTYTNVADGKRRTIERSSYAREFTRLWTRASRRHRLASLGAVWGQSLKVAAPAAPEVARRAEELATQNPSDERAKELATAATASSKLPSSSGF